MRIVRPGHEQWRRAADVQGVRKVSLQFRKFITRTSEKTDEWKRLQNESCIFKFSLSYLAHVFIWTLLVARQEGTRFLATFAVAYPRQ